MKKILTQDEYISRNLKRRWKNDGIRSLYESVLYPEVLDALQDWKFANRNNIDKSVLVGGLALSYYLRPRATEDLDLIFMNTDDIPTNLSGFKKTRPSAFIHLKTHVEIEVLTPKIINQPESRFDAVFKNAILSDGILVASPKSLIALKLNRFKPQDIADISNLLLYCKENNIDVSNFNEYDLSEKELSNLNSIPKSIYEYVDENKYILETYRYFNEKTPYIKIPVTEKYEICIFKDDYGDPNFHFGTNISSDKRTMFDFQFAVALNEDVENLKILYSTTGYSSFNGHRKEENILKKWLKENYNILINSWNKLNTK